MLFARSILCNLQRLYFCSLPTRVTREGWPLLTVETEVNGDSKGTNQRGPSSGWFFGLVVAVQEIFVQPWLYKIFFSSPYTFSIPCPNRPASWAGSRDGSHVS